MHLLPSLPTPFHSSNASDSDLALLVSVLQRTAEENTGVPRNPSEAILADTRCDEVLEASELSQLFGLEVHEEAEVRPHVVLLLVVVPPRAGLFPLEFLARQATNNALVFLGAQFLVLVFAQARKGVDDDAKNDNHADDIVCPIRLKSFLYPHGGHTNDVKLQVT